MNERRRARERLDAMLAGLEDGVLETGAAEEVELQETGVREGVEMIRSDIEALVGSLSGSAPGREPGASAGAGALGAKAKGKVAERLARLGRRVGLGPHGGSESGTLRVKMAFSGYSVGDRGEGCPEGSEPAEGRAGRRGRIRRWMKSGESRGVGPEAA